MKIGVLTHTGTEDNYGEILQALALQRYLKSLGHTPFLIIYDYECDHPKERFKAAKDMIRLVLRTLSKSRRESYNYVQKFVKLYEENAIKNKRRLFSQFVEEQMESSYRYKSYSELKDNPPLADAYIVGSDQVWNPSLHERSTAAWYLQFGKKETIRLSYAASIGRQIHKDEEKIFMEYLNKLDAVSLRESNAFEFCKSLGADNCQLVVDPTLLAPFSIYQNYINKDAEPTKPYAFLYYLNVESKEELAWDQLESFVTKEGLDLRTVSSSGYFPAQSLIPGNENELLTIPEWLTAVYHANCVITTSFHGTVLAILMHKPFVTIPLTNQYSSGNGRLVSLLKDLGLENRILTTETSISEIMAMPIDWAEVEARLDVKRKSSEKFLSDALKM